MKRIAQFWTEHKSLKPIPQSLYRRILKIVADSYMPLFNDSECTQIIALGVGHIADRIIITTTKHMAPIFLNRVDLVVSVISVVSVGKFLAGSISYDSYNSYGTSGFEVKVNYQKGLC